MQRWKEVILTLDTCSEIKTEMNKIVSAGIYSIESVNGEFDPLDESAVFLNKFFSKEDRVQSYEAHFPESLLLLMETDREPPYCHHKFYNCSFASFKSGDKFFFQNDEVRIVTEHMFCQRLIRMKLISKPPYGEELLAEIADSFPKEKEHAYKRPTPSYNCWDGWEPTDL